jgi:hypothetical protein
LRREDRVSSAPIELTWGQDAHFAPRYDTSFFWSALPDQRYIKLHAECCACTGEAN